MPCFTVTEFSLQWNPQHLADVEAVLKLLGFSVVRTNDRLSAYVDYKGQPVTFLLENGTATSSDEEVINLVKRKYTELSIAKATAKLGGRVVSKKGRKVTVQLR